MMIRATAISTTLVFLGICFLFASFSSAAQLRKTFGGEDDMPDPFTRELYLTDNDGGLEGSDVLIMCTLLSRDDAVTSTAECDSTFDERDQSDVLSFQKAHGLETTGIFNAETASLLLDLHSADGYRDSGFTAASMGYKYKLNIPVHYNRSVESTGTLFDAYNNILFTFPVRNHGHREDCSDNSCAWPDFGNGDIGLNEFTSNGNSVTGLIEVDLNSPEPNTTPGLYGPWPINRYVRGLEGNALLLLPNIRDGILLHTGNWTTEENGVWDPRTDTMPNSAGCHHSHPLHVEVIYKILTEELGVVVNENTYSGKNYPYQPQGIAVVEQID